MNFKEAISAYLDGNNVLACRKQGEWVDFGEDFGELKVASLHRFVDYDAYKFKLAPRSITVDGVKVPAPESVAPEVDATYIVPECTAADLWVGYRWTNHPLNHDHLQRGLVYLNKKDAIARAKAMLSTQ